MFVLIGQDTFNFKVAGVKCTKLKHIRIVTIKGDTATLKTSLLKCLLVCENRVAAVDLLINNSSFFKFLASGVSHKLCTLKLKTKSKFSFSFDGSIEKVASLTDIFNSRLFFPLRRFQKVFIKGPNVVSLT